MAGGIAGVEFVGQHGGPKVGGVQEESPPGVQRSGYRLGAC